MNFLHVSIAAFVVTASSAALAEEPALTPTWSVGAGLSLGSGLFAGGVGSGSPGGLGGLGGFSVAVPSLVPNVSIERAFSNRFALGLGLEAAVSTSSTVGARPNPASGSVAVGISPRFTLTSETAPVAFTVFGTGFTGYSGAGSNVSITEPRPIELIGSSRSLSVGVLGGVALEKRFFERLAVRVQAQLARVSLNRFWSESQALLGLTGDVIDSRSVVSVVNASFVPAPSIELRLYL